MKRYLRKLLSMFLILYPSFFSVAKYIHEIYIQTPAPAEYWEKLEDSQEVGQSAWRGFAVSILWRFSRHNWTKPRATRSQG